MAKKVVACMAAMPYFGCMKMTMHIDDALLERVMAATGARSKTHAVDMALREVDRRRLTHAALAAAAGLPRSAVTGILSGSLQKVTIDRVLRLVEAAGLEAEIRVRRAA